MTILVITTGGTIGALPYEDFSHTAEEGFVAIMSPNGQDFVRETLERAFPLTSCRCFSLEVTDSKLMDELYRFSMLKLIEDAPESKILITHGTDALLQTADFFYRQSEINSALRGKVVLLTGAMIPLSNGPESDGYLNLKFSLEQLERLNSVHICGEKEEKSDIYIVLCDYESPETESGAWTPRLYRYYPERYQKIYTQDGRYNRLKQVK